MLDVRIVLDDVPEYVFKACGAPRIDWLESPNAELRGATDD